MHSRLKLRSFSGTRSSFVTLALIHCHPNILDSSIFCEPVVHRHTKQDVLTDLDAFGFPRDYAVSTLGNKLDLSL